MKIETGRTVINVKGEAYKNDGQDVLFGHVIADALAGNQTGGKMKMYLLAEAAYKNPTLEVDAVDLGIIVKALESCTSYNNMILGQVLKHLDDIK